MFSLFIITYLFLGGCGAGLATVVCVWALILRGRLDPTDERLVVFEVYERRCLVVALIVLTTSALCLVYDLGRPSAIHELFFHPTTAVLSFGSYSLAIMLAALAALTACAFLYIPRMRRWVRIALEAVCAVDGAFVFSYTGVFLFSVKAVAFWDTLFLPALFVVSSVSMGLATALFLAGMSRDPGRLEPGTGVCRRIHIAAIVLEAFALMGFLAAGALGRGHAPESVAMLFSDDLLPWLAGGVLTSGLCVPLVFEALEVMRRPTPFTLVAEGLCLVGGFALRYCCVMAGIH